MAAGSGVSPAPRVTWIPPAASCNCSAEWPAWSAPDAYDRAASYLEHAQASDGGWNTGYISGPPNGNSTALAVGGLWAAGFDPQAPRFQKNGHGALDTLLTFQEPSGAFVYIQQPGQEEVRLMATLDVLTALASQLNGAQVCRIVYLPLMLR